MKLFRSNHPDDVSSLDTKQLRERFLIEEIFRPNSISMSYVQDDRLMVGGVLPKEEKLVLSGDTLSSQSDILLRREMGIINVGGPGRVIIGRDEITMDPRDGLYIGAGHEAIDFECFDKANPPRFYVASTPSHIKYDTVKIPFKKARSLHLGEPEKSNVRTIHQYIHPEICQSAQLLMGMTILEPGSLWNTMPCHTHDRRMEVYYYFDLPPQERVFHFMGEIDETRHLVVGSDQAVIAPSWSIHSGIGTASYSFIWSMAGENQDFDDMDFVETSEIK